MPNWTENSLVISKRDWAKFKEVAWDDEEKEVTFKKLLPEPLEVRIDAFYNSIFTNWDKDKDGDPEVPVDDNWFLRQQGEISVLRKNIRELGLNTEGWYNWHCNHWGTKWDACDTDVYHEDEIDDLDDDDQICIVFNTAWSDPEPWYRALAAVIPFETECTEEGGFFHYTAESDGKGNFDIHDDTEEYFKQREEDEEE
jgi:hypothetical protein